MKLKTSRHRLELRFKPAAPVKEACICVDTLTLHIYEAESPLDWGEMAVVITALDNLVYLSSGHSVRCNLHIQELDYTEEVQDIVQKNMPKMYRNGNIEVIVHAQSDASTSTTDGEETGVEATRRDV